MSKLEVSTKTPNIYVYFILKFGGKLKVLGYFKEREFIKYSPHSEKNQK